MEEYTVNNSINGEGNENDNQRYCCQMWRVGIHSI